MAMEATCLGIALSEARPSAFMRSLGVHLQHWSRKLPEQSIPHIAVGPFAIPPHLPKDCLDHSAVIVGQ